jgi:hypothetical protein
LIELHYEAGLAVVRKKSTKAPDVFAALDEDHIELNTELRMLRAVLLFQFKNDPKPRRVTIKPHNQTSYEHDEDSRVVSEWLTLREFAKTELPPKEVQDVAHLEIA